ncbi:SMP-30/gluconolactonase/LRE family protein [Agromyces sp. NPDC004153]
MSADRLTLATAEPGVLSEGPFWDPVRRSIHWVDIRRGEVLTGTLADDGTIDAVGRVSLPGTVGAMAPSATGEWIVANGDDLVVIRDGRVVHRMPVIGSDGARRFNDGKPDAAGRFLVGTMSLAGPSEREELLVVERDGSQRVLDDDLTLANGLGWSVDGARLHTIDTLRRRVYTRDYDMETGATGRRELLVELDAGFPDGMCVDAEDHLWIAVWGLGQVRRYTPGGDLVRVIEVPAPHTSSVAFAGARLDTLVITTAADELSPPQLEQYPHSGCLFTIVPGVTGLPQPLWAGFVDASGGDRA